MTLILNGTTGITSPGGDTSTSLSTGSLAISGTANTSALTVGNVALGAGNATRFKNRLINGDMRISQYNGSSSFTPTSTSYGTVDRWRAVSDVSSKYSLQQVTDAPTGFSFSTKMTSLSAYTVGATETFGIWQAIEGFNTADLGFGTANAKTITVSFWVKSSLTGAFGGSIQNTDYTRGYPFSYTISTANTWEQKTITIAGDITGTWVGATNGTGLILYFTFGAGSSRSNTANAWTGTQYSFAPTGSTSIVATNGATWQFTGVQLEVGSIATGFEYVDYGTQLAMCQRYYNNYGFASNQWYVSATTSYTGITFPQMRASPSVSSTGAQVQYGPGGQLAASVTAYGSTGATHSGLSLTQSGGAVSNAPGFCWGSVQLSAEL